MSLLLLLACLCGAAARGAPTARCLPESELEGYCRSRRLDGPAPGYKPTKKPSGPAPQCEDFGADVVEETIDRDADDDESARIKGFKPGTNAQRHRLHRIQHSRRASSRLADLTSMVRDSFRRVNVVSESSGDEKESAAARPAARPQLSWRASAPEYGTFES